MDYFKAKVDAGADYVKPSTGFGPGGATVTDVAKRQREIAKKKQQEEKDARKREAREAAKAAQSDQKPSSGS